MGGAPEFLPLIRPNTLIISMRQNPGFWDSPCFPGFPCFCPSRKPLFLGHFLHHFLSPFLETKSKLPATCTFDRFSSVFARFCTVFWDSHDFRGFSAVFPVQIPPRIVHTRQSETPFRIRSAPPTPPARATRPRHRFPPPFPATRPRHPPTPPAPTSPRRLSSPFAHPDPGTGLRTEKRRPKDSIHYLHI